MLQPYQFKQGNIPLLISMPHVGITIPSEISAQLNTVAHIKTDTDWHLPLLYNMAQSMGASILQAEYSRYVIDLNRSSDDSNLYPGQDTTGLCPIDTFSKEALYPEAKMPNAAEVQRRIALYWKAYHQQLQDELIRLRELHGVAILWDAHSIASHVPRFFQGKLPDLNFGTADGKSCDPRLQNALSHALLNTSNEDGHKYTYVFNGRFKGGFITRNYGKPELNIHAIQLEMSQCTYMNEAAPFLYREDLASQIQPLLGELLATCVNWAQENNQL